METFASTYLQYIHNYEVEKVQIDESRLLVETKYSKLLILVVQKIVCDNFAKAVTTESNLA